MLIANPYVGKNFFSFLLIFIKRLFMGFFSEEGFFIAHDELQIFILGALAVSCSLVGTFLVLRKMTMLANSLSHTILIGIVASYLLQKSHIVSGGVLSMVIAAFVTSFITMFLTEVCVKNLRLQKDASIGLVFTSLFAMGIILVTMMTRNSYIGIEAVMGNADLLLPKDFIISLGILAFNLCVLILFYPKWHITTFDSSLAKTCKISALFFSYLLMFQTSLTVVGSFRMVGVLLVLAFLVAPPLIARLLCDTLKGMLMIGALVGFLSCIIGVGISRHFLSIYQMPLSTGGIVVSVLGGFYVLAIWFSKTRKIAHKKVSTKSIT